MSIERTKEDQERFHADMARIASLLVTKAIEAMERKPTAAAMRAAHAIAEAISQEMMDIEHAPDLTLAEYIDRETGLPELIDACKEALHCMIPTGADTRTDRAMQQLVKALAKAEGT